MMTCGVLGWADVVRRLLLDLQQLPALQRLFLSLNQLRSTAQLSSLLQVRVAGCVLVCLKS